MFALCEEYTIGTRKFLLAFPSLSERESRPSLNGRGLLPPTFDNATWCVCVGMMTLSVHTIVLWARHDGDKQVPQTHSRNLPLLPQRRDQLQKNMQLRLLLAKSCLVRSAKGHSSSRPKWRVGPPASNLSTLLVAYGLTWCANFLH